MNSRPSTILTIGISSLAMSVQGMLLVALILPGSAMAEWEITGTGSMFYTDDVALFSATRRLSRDSDPTQPAIDDELADEGDDVVFEPTLQIRKSFGPQGRATTFTIRGQGFLFADHSRFNHGTLGVQGLHVLSPDTTVGFRYYYSPDLLLGNNSLGTR